MTWTIQDQSEGSVPNPPSGFIRFFPDGGAIKYKDSTGTVFTLATGLTQEQVEDIVANLIVPGSSKVTVVYDDIGNSLAIDINESDINHQNLNGAGVNTHAQIDTHIGSNANPHGVTPAQIGADPAGTAASEVSTHEGEADPHPQYAQESALATVATSGDHSDLNLDDGTNPHGTTKGDVGLSSVPNVDATQRANHVGTQIASTISDFEAALAAYLDRFENQDDNEQVNTTTLFDDRFNETYNFAHTADYVVRLNYTWAYDDATTDFIAELLVNGVIQREHQQEPKDVGGSGGGAGTDQRYLGQMEYRFAAVAGNNDIQLRFRSSSGGVEATIRDHCLTIERWK